MSSKDPGDVTGKWNYGTASQFPYGDETTYRKAMDFLDGPYVIEDWGCGVAWARRFAKQGRYIGLDGSWSMHCDQVVDLRTYRSKADAILMRHLIEHNYDWRKILENALASFQKKLVLVMFTPFADVTRQIGTNFDGAVPDIAFRKQDLLDMIGSLPYTEEAVATATQYGVEHIFYITRSPEPSKAVQKPLVSVVIPTYQHLEDLLKPNLESLIKFTDLSHVEVIVVANGCSDGTEKYVESLGPPFRALSYHEPLGYPKATNRGIEAAKGDYVVLLNNDIVFLDQPKGQWLRQLLAPFESDPLIGITGPLQLHDYYSDQDVIVGSCLCVSRKALQAAGGVLDEAFSPGGGEDVDLCCRVRDAGFAVRQVPKEGKPGSHWTNVDGTFMIWHKNNQTFKDMKGYWKDVVPRNGIRNLKRHNDGPRLNLFGESRWGYVSVGDPTDLVAYAPLDPLKLDLEDRSVAEILAVQPFETLAEKGTPAHASDILKEWFRVLKPGGKLTMELPDLVPYLRHIYHYLVEAGFTGVNKLPVVYSENVSTSGAPNIRIEAMRPPR